MRKINQRMGNNDQLLELCEKDGEVLRDLNTYIPNLLKYLWEQPKIVVRILESANINVVKNHLAPLFANNFYENILSSYYIEDNLMYVLTLLIKSEISKLNNINQTNNFLNNTPCGYLLGELRRKSDIQAYFKTIVTNAIENLETNNSNYKINFKPDDIASYHKNNKKDDAYLKFPSGDSNSGSESIEANIIRDKRKEQSEQENFNKNYIPNLDKSALIKLIEENKNNKNIYDYLYSKLSLCEKDDSIFINGKLLNFFSKYKRPEGLIILYQNRFMIVINFIDQIIKNILNNFHLVPYSIKCLCRIISETISIKFPKINVPDKCAFIAKFFFGKLLLPILNNPGVEAFVNTFISENSLQNLKEISKIFEKYVSNSFYTTNELEFNYTPYNWYFINNINNLFTIFEEVVKIRFPSFIEKLVNNQLPADYEYNYFIENPDEVINFRSIFFNLEQIRMLTKTINDHDKEIFKDNKGIKIKKAVEKLMLENNQDLFDYIIYGESKKDLNNKKDKKKEKDKDKRRKSEIFNEKKFTQKIQYFLVTCLDKNSKYEKLLNIEYKPYFSITEIKELKDEEAITKNNIIRAKNYFFSLLYNYHKLVKTDFDEGTTENTEKILTELNMFMKSSNLVMDGSIPSEWYVNSLLEYLKKLPEYLTKNDCEELYNEMEKDLNGSIKRLDFEALSFIMCKLKFASRSKIYYQQSLELLEDIESNELVRNIITEKFIPVDIKFEYGTGDTNFFEILVSKFKEKEKNNEEKKSKYEKSNEVRLCCTIEMFTRKFPNLIKYQEFQDADVFEIQEELNFPKNIHDYMLIIRKVIKITTDTILEKKFEEEQKLKEQKKEAYLDSLMDKVYDYVMGKLYDKIYPIEPLEEDNKIFKQSVLLSWTKPKHFLKTKKEFVFGSFEHDVLENLKLLDMDKSPRKKLLDMKAVFNSIMFLLRFNGKGPDAGVDDQLPILNYICIKAQPLRMASNVKFMELYIGDKGSKGEGSQLTQFKGICEIIPRIEYKQLNDVTQQEFMEKCNEAIKEIKF